MSQDGGTNSTAASVPVAVLLGVLFVALKLCHVIDWSWWWVTLPFWGPPALAVVIMFVALVVALFKP